MTLNAGTQLYHSGWMTAALLDRLTYGCVIFEMNSEGCHFCKSMKPAESRECACGTSDFCHFSRSTPTVHRGVQSLARSPYRPRLELLEARDLPANFTIQVDPDAVIDTRDADVTTYARAGAVSVIGTNGDDAMTVRLAAGRPFNLIVDGKGGHDSIVVQGTKGNALIHASYASTTLSNSKSKFTFLNFEAQQYQASQGQDMLVFQGGPSKDTFTHTRAADTLTDAGHSISAIGFERIEVRLSRADTAVLDDSKGTDIFWESGNYARLMDLYQTYFVGLQGQGSLYLYGRAQEANVVVRPASMRYQFQFSGFTDLSSFMVSQGATSNLKRLSSLLDPSLLGATSVHDLAVRLRNHVYQSYVLGSNTAAFLTVSPLTRYINALVSKNEKVLCQGAQILYAELLDAYGIKNRKVYLWARDKYNNHATNEIFINGRWIIEDPSFGVEFRNGSGRLLSFSDIRTSKWHLERNGYLPRKDRPTFEQYPITLDNLVTYIVYSPGNPFQRFRISRVITKGSFA